MPEMTSHSPGTFCWVDLATNDPTGAKQFYGELFGWNATDTPAGGGMIYTNLDLEGKAVGALYEMNEQMRASGMPPWWANYISVESADNSAAKAKELGGKVMMEPFDVMDVGRMAAISDPTGAVFHVWQPKLHCGAQLVGEPGAMCWQELATKDADAAAAFYTGLFGWQAKESSFSSGPPYTEFWLGDQPVAGMIVIQPEWGQFPPCWGVYFQVANFDESYEKAKGLGAKPGPPPMEIDGVGKFGTMQDPQGAHFMLLQPQSQEA